MLSPPDTSSFEQSDTRTDRDPLISVVVPVYKEEKNVGPFLRRLEPVLEQLGSYEVLFCLDPSPDGTEVAIRREVERNPRIGLLVFSRRFGQPAATMAGILNCRGQWCVVIDVDLQDPPELIEQLLRKSEEGYEVVTAKRRSREGETLVKKMVSAIGYSLINRIAEVRIPRNTGDFRIISRRVIEELRGLSEGRGFLRGLVSLVGFSQAEVLYERDARFAGAGNYNRYLGSLKVHTCANRLAGDGGLFAGPSKYGSSCSGQLAAPLSSLHDRKPKQLRKYSISASRLGWSGCSSLCRVRLYQRVCRTLFRSASARCGRDGLARVMCITIDRSALLCLLYYI